MGMFSFICQKSGKEVLHEDSVHLFLLENGKVLEHMFGNYDSYGRVEGFKWKKDWTEICSLMFSNNLEDGICAILEPYWEDCDGYPTERSELDPNQGCGESKSKKVENSFHKVF